ncbi:859_t:CDS:2 [Funneliformis mosseae]|uniref:Eukaryotic translation initiation factor 3 30 kDa subunit n=1 Tax=Funneliformis mosseae TaxID=27381 RepID=A0A9N8VZB0_FUNMO|nr:859_t:CDS:2 [Funneliformis mosseae]
MESSDEEEKKKSTTPAPPPKKKKSVAQQIAEREELKRKAAEQKARISFISVIDADLENAEGMFQGVTIRETEGSPLDMTIPMTNPKTKEDFEEFSKLLVDQIRKNEKQGLYVNFINDFIRELCAPLRDVDVRKFASKVKPALQTEKFDLYDTTDYGNYDDFDDFM